MSVKKNCLNIQWPSCSTGSYVYSEDIAPAPFDFHKKSGIE